jgi:hypothetical protein
MLAWQALGYVGVHMSSDNALDLGIHGTDRKGKATTSKSGQIQRYLETNLQENSEDLHPSI